MPARNFYITNRLAAAIGAAGARCEAIIDGPVLFVDSTTACEPDAMVRCGDPLDGETVRVTDPVIIVEILSPSTRGRDTGAKLADYFRLPSLHHYLIVNTGNRTLIHHARAAHGTILTRILRDGPIMLDPPRITLTDPFPPGA